MKIKTLAILMLVLAAIAPLSANNNNKKHDDQRGMLEKMDAVPCGAKERGLSGLGTLWASAGITHVNSDEKLCPQYLLRTDQMDYEIRPLNLKHAVILPVGHEGVFKLKKNCLYLSFPEDGLKKTRAYEVVSMIPANTGDEGAKSSSLDDEHDEH
ncbi:MAG TPA: hypothetical protein VMD77_03940 [Candidatus Baltobacteraceae bacterium]|jgi:hypothetical protein|nr:hypothetical protein [Candidatus Baltobacteraceae bacterium]